MRHYRFTDWITQGFLAGVALQMILVGWDSPRLWIWRVAGHVGAMVLIHGMISRCEKCQVAGTFRWLRDFYPLLLYTVFYQETALMNQLIGRPRLDPQLMRLEHHLFGVQPSIVLMQKAPWAWVSEPLYAAYFSFYLMIAGWALWSWFRNRDIFHEFVAVVSFVFYGCYLLFMWIPAIGPRLMDVEGPERELWMQLYPGQIYPSFPDAIRGGPCFQLMAWIYQNLEIGSAAIPSSHVAVALTTLWFTWQHLRPLRGLHAGVVVLLCISTVYCRYHYAVDVVAGILAAVVLVPLAERAYRASMSRS